MATLGTLFGGSWLAMRGGEKKTAQGPPINASSKDEEAFIQYGQKLVLFVRWTTDGFVGSS
jgi:F-type H+-transporting ATPase subunit k